MIEFLLLSKIFLRLIGLIIISGLWLGFWVYLSGKKNKANQLFLLVTLFLLIWVFFGFLITLPNQLIFRIILWTKLAYIGVFGWIVSTYFFLNYFPSQGKRSPFFDWIVLGSGIVLSSISFFTNLLVKDVAIKDTIPTPILGKGLVPVYGAIIVLTFLILRVLFQKYFKFSKEEKLKTQYFLIGLLCFISTNVIFNVFLSPRLGMIPYAYIGNYSAIVFLAFTAYAIVKRELFGIKVVLSGLFVALIAILLAMDALILTPQPILQLIKAGILVIFLYFGYLLIKSVLEEIKRREQLEKLTLQLETAHIKLSGAYQKLQRLDQAKSEFVSIASHQLRTPLTAIKGYVSMLIEGTYGKVGERAVRPLENVYKSNERLIKLVNDLLSVSRIEAGRVELELKPEAVEDIISSVVGELENEAKKKGLELKWEKPKESLPKVLIDKEKIRQVLLNLIDNAIRYTNHGQVAVKVKTQISKVKDKGEIIIKIKDTGEGLTKEEIAKLFESFSRASAGSRLWTEGTGLGLYVAKKFVQMHKGRIWAESHGKGRGSTFYIELPMRQIG